MGTGNGRITSRPPRSVNFTPSGRVYIFGGILWVALTICSRHFDARGGPAFIASLAVAGVAYLLAIREFFSTPVFQRRLVVIGLVLAACWHFQFLWLPPGPDDDVHRYVWDGRLQRLGYNPYVVVPNDPAVRGLHTAETRTLNNPDLPSPYPAGAQLFFRAVTAIHESTFALKAAFTLCDFAIVFLLLDVLRREHRAAHLVLAYAWNPLLAIEVAGSGHIDIVGTLLLLVSFAALARQRRTIAALGFGLSVAMKLLPIILLPLYWKRIRMRDAAFAAVMVGVLYLPFVGHGRIPIGSLGTYVHEFRFNDPLFGNLELVAPQQLVALLPALIGFVVAIYSRKAFPLLSPDGFAWPMTASLLCAPVVYPWYLLWPLPFLRSTSTLPIVIWTVSVIPTYVVWHFRTLGRAWSVPGWIVLLEYGSVAMACVILALRRFAWPAVTRRPMDHAAETCVTGDL
jgi:alpha-1,6-mannosyltransferase